MSNFKRVTLYDWPFSQICQDCKHGKFFADDQTSGQMICLINSENNFGVMCDDQALTEQQKELPMVEVHTDGACSGNPGQGGWGFVMYKNGVNTFENSGADPRTTNNKMELMAIISFLDATPKDQSCIIYTDSKYCEGIINLNWKIKVNQDLWNQYFELANGRNITVIWEPRDSSEGNKRANALAQAEAKRRLACYGD